MKGVNLEELIFKGLKRVNDLIARPVDRKSVGDLEKRLSEINVSRSNKRLGIVLKYNFEVYGTLYGKCELCSMV